MAIEKLKRHKSPGIDQIPAEVMKARGGGTTHCEIHNFINFVWNKEELPEEWKESIDVPFYKKGDKTDCSNYMGISLSSTTYKILSSILLSMLTPHAGEIIGYHQCGFRRRRLTTDHIFCIRQILEKKWELNETVHQLFMDLKETYDSVRSEVLCNILVGSGIPMKLARLVKVCLSEICNRVKRLFDMFRIKSGLKQGDALTPLLFNVALEYASRRVQVNQDG
jgi:hypothetical protein